MKQLIVGVNSMTSQCHFEMQTSPCCRGSCNLLFGSSHVYLILEMSSNKRAVPARPGRGTSSIIHCALADEGPQLRHPNARVLLNIILVCRNEHRPACNSGGGESFKLVNKSLFNAIKQKFTVQTPSCCSLPPQPAIS